MLCCVWLSRRRDATEAKYLNAARDSSGLSADKQARSHQTLRLPNVSRSREKDRTTWLPDIHLRAPRSVNPSIHPLCLHQTAHQVESEVTNNQCNRQPSSASSGALPKDLLDSPIHHLRHRRRSRLAHLLRILLHSQSSRGHFHASDNQRDRRLAAVEQEI